MVDARACVCSCFRERFASGTFRAQAKPLVPAQLNTQAHRWACWAWGDIDENGERKFLIDTPDLVEALWNKIWPKTNLDQPSGLVVFAGATNSGKTNVAMAFALRAIQRSLGPPKGSKRLPHLVTFEDPIEVWKISTRLRP